VVGHELLELLLLARNVRRAPWIGVETRIRHLCIEFVETTAKRANVGKFVHEKSKKARRRFANCASRRLRLG
jgi:hypothetical protein